MRAKIKSVRKINDIFLYIFTYILKSDIFSTFLNFYEKCVFGHFQGLISKSYTYRNLAAKISFKKSFLIIIAYISNLNDTIS